MKILFTGASSFTGYWFVKALAKAGHEVITTFRRPLSIYQGIRRERIESLIPLCRPAFESSFGHENFFKLIREEGPFDLLCHHAADVTNYKDPAFDVLGAVGNNTFNLKNTLLALQGSGCNKILLTGSVFEQGEGAGSEDLRAVSPYGLSKGLTSEFFQFYTTILGMKLGKFVIPNPFGPYEEARFTSFLAQTWLQHKMAPVSMPAYVRDNIHSSLLALAYADFAKSLNDEPGITKLNPSGYPESQGAFVLRFAREIGSRLGIPCEVDLQKQKEFPEPKVRINTDLLDAEALGWNESKAWDDLAKYYQRLYQAAPVR